MIKNYFYISLLFLCLSTSSVLAQESKSTSRFQENTIEGLSVYPNPTNGDRIYITSKYNYDKDIVIFDVLGKKVLQTLLTSKELNISALTPGIYIIQVKENEIIATRKLIIK
ncbi:T9SS type A sorting domain-containing protein [Flavobacterium aciduliphilum]|uniref:Putative secreted protein (Por secretion system target) n=1 Tax=Flavobacterium aciduliphilum TaxID=1101402 RepID=A0A328YET1_9FLAO|nr:T9SS type A sorting domain-containing protein [Flavobacterium aciduliphilum]RAR72511.1 putative secreted protein (Por secretion system target) [Flavobacterium aciduliphilum]